MKKDNKIDQVNFGGTKVVDMLKQDHAKLRRDIKALLEMDVGHEVVQKAEEFSLFLSLHQKIEEEALYPPLEKVGATRDKTLEGLQEHHVLDILIEELAHLNPKDKEWTAKLTVIKENLEHHLKEEEEDLFPKVSANLDKAVLEKVTEQALEIKQDAKI